MRRMLLACLLILALGGALPVGAAWAAGQISDPLVVYEFGQSVTFSARLQTDQAVKKAVVFFQAQNDTRTNLGQARVIPNLDGSAQMEYVHPIADYNLPAFAWVEYRWEVTLEDGQVLRTAASTFFYRDNRFAWSSLEEPPFHVYWYEGDLQFAQDVLDAAQQGVIQVQQLIPLPLPTTLDIYIYPDSATMKEALHPNSADWVAGHADPDLGVVVAALPTGPDRQLLIQQRIPHELMHILLYQSTNLGYRSLPTWLNEGLSSLAELYPSSDYQIILEDAVARDALLPMSSLCQSFPRDASNAILSYAQSASFVKYLHGAYGTSGLQELISTYANGLDCERGAQRALGRSLSQLERSWRGEALAEDTTAAAAANLLPWVVLLAAVLAAPLGLVLHRARSRPRP
ncbi:MAG: peptidase MA family metallohydrolase [Chloroflexota bacterium]